MGMALSTPQDKKSKAPAGQQPTASNVAENAKEHRRRRAILARIKSIRKKPKSPKPGSTNVESTLAAEATPATPTTPSANTRRPFRGNVIPELPRPPTFKRIQSEKRDKLRPYEVPHHERRAKSSDMRRSSDGPRVSSRSLQPIQSRSVRSVSSLAGGETPTRASRDALANAEAMTEPELVESSVALALQEDADPKESAPELEARSETVMSDSSSERSFPSPPLIAQEVEEELDWRWILNLSMHFRDESNREKFFVTYAQEKNLRRRITISCDYRNAKDGSLEQELSELRYQRDKSAKIYEAIRESLQDIMFYDTITNLKLQTADGRLHVHVTEDLNEIIPYPPVMAIAHLRCPKYREGDLEFESHLSGFVYKVKVHGEIFIKKEIPGPDTVDEFLYEINALYALGDRSDNVIRFGGCVLDDQRQKVKGLLISFASKGALIDIIYNERGRLPWTLREKWAKQIVSGLAEIHEAGYVQGDFTLSNIVIDEHEDAKIIDINRRGCPVGWEPPEITAMIEGLQRIGMYIGVKSDLYQLGMVLWGIAHQVDEPEAPQHRPFTLDQVPDDVPGWFRDIVRACLSDEPQGRPNAKDIVGLFPERLDDPPVIVERVDIPPESAQSPVDSGIPTEEFKRGSSRRSTQKPMGPRAPAKIQLNGEALKHLSATPGSRFPTSPSAHTDAEGNVVVVDASPSTNSSRSVSPDPVVHITSLSSSPHPGYEGAGGVFLPASTISTPEEEDTQSHSGSQYSQSGVSLRDIPSRADTVSPGDTEMGSDVTPIAEEKNPFGLGIRETAVDEGYFGKKEDGHGNGNGNAKVEPPVVDDVGLADAKEVQAPVEDHTGSNTDTETEKGL